MSLSSEQEASYSATIDLILKESDLNTVSAKKVRKELSERLGHDISAHKDAVNALIGLRFDNFSNGGGHGPPNEKTAAPQTHKAVPFATSKAKPGAPKPALVKTARPTADEDAILAARLQDEENRQARPTRGGVVKRRAPTTKEKKASKKKFKSAATVRTADESGLSSPDEAEPKERTGAFFKLLNLSPPLAALLNETVLSRTQTVSKIWAYVKERDLQDPNDRRYIRCDDALRAVFKSDRVHMFTMNKILAQNLYAQDE